MDYDGAHENERHILLQEQRACRARAHKFSLETSRRRKALEDRRRQWDAQEQRIRENILQLRKQRMQDATERFQRAHIRPSQRRRPAFVKRAINIDEALNIIDVRGTYAKPSVLVSNTFMGRNSTPTPRPHTFSSSVGHLATEERNHRPNEQFFLNDLQDTQGLLKDGEGIYPWVQSEEHANLSSPTESLSSQDSLEIEELKQRQHLKPSACFQSSLTQREHLQSPETYSNGQRPLSPTVPHHTKKCASEILLPSSAAINHSEGHSHLRDELAEEIGGPQSLTPAKGHYNLKDLPQNNQEKDAFGYRCLCAQMRTENHLGSMAHHNCGRTIATTETHKETALSHHQNKISACHASQCTELTCWEQECRTYQNVSEPLKTTEEDQLEHQSVTPEEQTCSHNCRQRHSFSKNGISSSRVSAPESQSNEVAHSHQSNKPHTNINPLNKEETHATLSRTVTMQPPSVATDVRVLKSILKKHSKYQTEETRYMYGSGHVIITKHMALSLRDSLELMRGKKKEPENDKIVKKKLRWFDEVNVENQDKTVSDTIDSALTKSRPRVAYQHHTEAVSTIPAAPSAPSAPQCPFARQAWTDIAAQDSKSLEQPPQDGLKTQRAFTCFTVPKVPRRARSARAGHGHGHTPVRIRKDATLRPQSATEASHMIKQQRKIIMPCPPPRPEVSDRKMVASSTKAAYADEHRHSRSVHPGERTLYRSNPDGQDGSPPNEGVALVPCPPSYGCPSSDTLAKGRISSSQHGTYTSARRCGAACGENGICLNRTPTDDEISQLWSGVRSALSNKDDGASQAQVMVTDDSMTGDVRSLGGMGGLYISPLNARRSVRRASSEMNGSKKTMLIQMPGSGNRKFSAPNQAPLLTITMPNKVQDQGPIQRMGPPQQTPILSLSGLSLEEQRVQQSLDRINQRLQYVVGGNPSVKRLLHTEATHLNTSAKLGERSSSGQRRLSTPSNGH